MRYYAFALVAGIAAFQFVPALPPRSFYLALPPLLVLLCRSGPVRLGALCAIGFLWAMWRADMFLALRLSPQHSGQLVRLTGTVTGPPVDFGAGFRFDVDASKTYDLRGQALALPRLRLTWYAHGPYPQAGARCALIVRLKPPGGVQNDGGFDREKWLFRERIAATGTVVPHRSNRCRPDSGIGSLNLLRGSVAARITDALAALPHGGVIAALAVADRSAVDDAEWATLRATGTAHLLAISGLHIALVAGGTFVPAHWTIGLLAPVNRRWPVQRPAALAAFGAAVTYAALAGFPVSTQRAVVMVAVVLLMLSLRRRAFSTDALGMAMATVAVLDPFTLLGSGFWLSFGAVAWLVLLNLSHAPAAMPARLLRMHVCLAVGLAPLLGVLYQSLPLGSPLANLVAVPVVTLTIVPLVLSGVLVLPISTAWADVLWRFALEIWTLLWTYLSWLADALPPLALPTAPTPLATALALAGVCVVFVPVLRWRWLLGAVLLAALGVGQRQELPAGHLRVTVLDVGQGLAVVAETAKRVLVYDTGPGSGDYSAGTAIVAPFLRARGIHAIDTLILSHADNDHAGGWPGLAAAVPVATLMLSPGHDTPAPAARCRAGARWTWDDVAFEILYPLPTTRGTGNDLSCVVKISTAAGSVLLPGDIERRGENALIAHAARQVRADVLIAPHHGSETSSSARFIDAVAPRYVIFAAGASNRFGFPRPAVVRAYERAGAGGYVTGEEGAIELLISDTIETPRSFRRTHPRYWRYQPETRSQR